MLPFPLPSQRMFFKNAKGQGADDVFAKVSRGNEELVVVKHDAVEGAPLVS